MKEFLSTLSLRRATRFTRFITIYSRISIHALLAESDAFHSSSVYLFCISIHALLAESDASSLKPNSAFAYFYPRSPCGERPSDSLSSVPTDCDFYPRSPCGERLDRDCAVIVRRRNFYPRSPCGERLAPCR